MGQSLIHMYRHPALGEAAVNRLLAQVRAAVPAVKAMATETCFNIEVAEPLNRTEAATLAWFLAETFEPDQFAARPFLCDGAGLVEVGPRMNFTTAWSTNTVAVCRACGLGKVGRIERSRRFAFERAGGLRARERALILPLLHDRMTECPYPKRLATFAMGIKPAPWSVVPVIEEGRAALERINRELGLAFDDWDLDYYTNLFTRDIGRNPTTVELFDIGQSNSEHSRHWFFRGRLIVDGRELPGHLIQVVKDTLDAGVRNSIIAFNDNSSAIRGARIRTIVPVTPGRPSPFRETGRTYHIIFTAETHNFPTGVAPFPGAETGTGGRIRDVQATGRGGLVVAGTAAYCVGNLRIPGYSLPWEDAAFAYPANLAAPLAIAIGASNGASDYGNKFGEPLIQGYTRAFGLRLPGGERREWIKPIMFTGGVGQMDGAHVAKRAPRKGMRVVKIGGPAYRIGIGGGAASSMVQGDNAAELDFNAVQRGDAEMEQKVNRVIRACIEMGAANPIVSIHDQGAGGNCNVVKEIINPAGGVIHVRRIPVGDATLSVLEIWGAEYQEQNALLVRAADARRFQTLCDRENVPVAFIGEVDGSGRIRLVDDTDGTVPVDLELEKVLGSMPRKTFKLDRVRRTLKPLRLPARLTVAAALDRVFRLVSVGSKRFLTNKVDRSVTGLIARQQCAGPLQLTVADVAVIAQSHFGVTGAAIAIGEQPLKTLIDPAAMARLAVAEALTNLVWAPVTKIEDIKCSGNWMWAAKLPGEGADLYDAAIAMRDCMLTLGIAIDGGKDSVSMAARVPGKGGTAEVVKAPGSLVISAYVTCPDITAVVTPDIKHPGASRLWFVDLGGGAHRLGGSALAQVHGQIGDAAPDVDAAELKRVFNAMQRLVRKRLVAAGHDRSDGGLVTTVLEMAFAGNCGLDLRLPTGRATALEALFSEAPGLVFEPVPGREKAVAALLRKAGVAWTDLGRTTAEPAIRIRYGRTTVLDAPMADLRATWEATSFQLERLQSDPACVAEEEAAVRTQKGIPYAVPFVPRPTPPAVMRSRAKVPVAIIREEGSNGDREMTSAFHAAGFEPWDVTMTDLRTGSMKLDRFRGVVFVGGFSYADVLDSAKGWAGVIRFHDKVWRGFQSFYERPDTFSLGVCNGCQLMALLGWVPWMGLDQTRQPRFIRNRSGRFESRFAGVRILPSPAVMLQGMEDAVLGIWVAHGEGRMYFPDPAVGAAVMARDLAPVRYVDDCGAVTQSYPFNPNGSPDGIAGLCSPDGRHLAMMPHPERVFLKWQWGHMPPALQALPASPWLKMFQNARQWCEGMPARRQR
ncbi:MAG: phosphoribosylformylglycinamidine synthase [Planctomycetota bacterium]